MDLTKEEYERLIVLQAGALGCAEQCLATLREEHERLKKDLEEKREFTMDYLEKNMANAKAQEELKKALEEERKLTRELRAMYVDALKNCTCDWHKNELKKALEGERKLTRDLRRQIVAAAQTKAQEVLS